MKDPLREFMQGIMNAFFPHTSLVTNPHFKGQRSHTEILQKVLPLLTDSRAQKMRAAIHQRTYQVTAVLDTIYDEGNISAVARTLENLGIQTLNVIDSPRTKNMRNVSKGSEAWMEIHHSKDRLETLRRLKKQGFTVVATHLSHESISLHQLDLTTPLAVIMGNEKDGVAPECIEECHHVIKIPAVGLTQSFNISVAAAIIFYQIFHARQNKWGRMGELSPQEEEILLAHWCLRNLAPLTIQNLFKAPL